MGLFVSGQSGSLYLAKTISSVDKLTPAAFEKHSGRETAKKWKNNVWVIVGGEKIPLSKTVLLKYYNEALKKCNRSNRRSQGTKVFHRDEFVGCIECGKERRFRLRSRDECRLHHNAMADPNWKCSDFPYDKIDGGGRITCEAEEERGSRKVYRGCTRSPTCKGCTSCVCFGCELCRFSDCTCQTCVDFTSNVKA
ncbi:Protein ULTRAPETALA 1 [Raphanus sativus]|nr:Protein ULTRAPETALA 1 [Raphanus sativus]